MRRLRWTPRPITSTSSRENISLDPSATPAARNPLQNTWFNDHGLKGQSFGVWTAIVKLESTDFKIHLIYFLGPNFPKAAIVRGGAVSEKTSLHSRLKSTVENKTPAFQQPSLLPRGICKPFYGIRNFYPLANGIYFIVMIGKTPFYIWEDLTIFPSHEYGPSPPGTFHILIGKFSYFVIIFKSDFFLSLTFPISLSDFYLIAL